MRCNVSLLPTILTGISFPAGAAELRGHQFTTAEGWEVKIAAEPPLVHSPIEASLDEKGRLYVTESSGSNEPVEEQLRKKPHRVLRLTDTDGDGRFDARTVFADGMMFPEGCLWHGGSLYVAAPPVIWKLTDADDDGTAERREVWFDGKTCTGCANDLHGPYRGPDGWLYWCKGAFAEQTYQIGGKEWKTRASHIFRARPDGSGIEPVMTGGMDNPVGLTWTAEGERILSCTFVQHPAGGHRDALLHAVSGGVWGKDHDVLRGHVRTGPLMPVMTHLGPAAPAGLERLSTGEVLCCQFNLRRVSLHVLQPRGAGYATEDSGFLVSDHADFHPTDVMECPDGSVLVVDTGGWYKLCCPTSQIAKPDIPGAIYRLVRTKSAPERKPEPCAAVWDASRRGDLAAVRQSLDPGFGPAAHAAALAAALHRDREAIPQLLSCLASADAALARAAAEALGRCGAGEATALLCSRAADAAAAGDRMLEHSCLYALCTAGEAPVLAGIFRAPPVEAASVVKRVCLIALEERGRDSLKAEEVIPLLGESSQTLRETAAAFITSRPGWDHAADEWIIRRIGAGDLAGVHEVLKTLAPRRNIAGLLAAAAAAGENAAARAPLLEMMAEPLKGAEKGMPPSWIAALAKLLEQGNPEEHRRVLRVLEVQQVKDTSPYNAALRRMASAEDGSDPAVRLEALSLLPRAQWPDGAVAFAGDMLATAGPSRSRVLKLFSRLPAEPDLAGQFLALVPSATVIELPLLLQVLARTPDEASGMRMLEGMVLAGTVEALPDAVLAETLKPFPDSVKQKLEVLRAARTAENEARRATLDEFAASLPAGDPARGHVVFQSAKAACTTCHQAGYKGGDLGPDLTRIGSIRTPRDLLESIMFPGASFVRSYEPVSLSLTDGSTLYGMIRNQGETSCTIAAGVGAEITVETAKIGKITPGSVSLMPAGLDQILTKQELADLIAFLAGLK